MKHKPTFLTLSASVVLFAAFAAYVWYWCGPGGSGVLAALQLPDRSEYVVAQLFHHIAEPYSVGFYSRSSGRQLWSWRYIDHEAARWRAVTISYDAAADRVLVTERGTLRAVLDRSQSTFWFNNGRKVSETATPAILLVGDSIPHFDPGLSTLRPV